MAHWDDPAGREKLVRSDARNKIIIFRQIQEKTSTSGPFITLFSSED